MKAGPKLLKTEADVEAQVNKIDNRLESLYQKKRVSPPTGETDLVNLKKKLLDLPKISLTLAIAPTDTLISQLTAWVRKETKSNAVLDIKIDPTIVGGLILTYNGRYLDLSVKKKILNFKFTILNEC